MTPPNPVPVWPDPAAALDEQLDLAGVMAMTGCTEGDFADLAAIFLDEVGNMNARLERAAQAMSASQGADGWPAAVEQLRTAAHELKTSFGIVGAKRAEAYANHTQQCTRKGSTLADPPPTAEQLHTAASGLLGGVARVAELLKQR